MASDCEQARAAAVVREIAAGGRARRVARTDVTSEGELEALVASTVRTLGRATILVNNAGGGGPQPFDMPMDRFVAAYRLNVFSAFRLSQLCAPHMEAAGCGAILNISSMAGENRNVRMTSYASSKAAVNHLTANMACDLGPRGIRVNAIAPGAVHTAALDSVLTPDVLQQMLRRTPLGRIGEPEDIALAALFLCSPAASLDQRAGAERERRRYAGAGLSRPPRVSARRPSSARARRRPPASRRRAPCRGTSELIWALIVCTSSSSAPNSERCASSTSR